MSRASRTTNNARDVCIPARLGWNAALATDEDGFQALLQILADVLKAEMTEGLQAENGERTACRLGYRSGYYVRKLVTRIGVIERRGPQDHGRAVLITS